MALKLSEGALYYSGGYVFSSIYRDYLHQQNNSCSDQNGSEAFSNRKSHDFFFFLFFTFIDECFFSFWYLKVNISHVELFLKPKHDCLTVTQAIKTFAM